MTKVHCCIVNYYDVPCTEDCPSKTITQTAAEKAVEEGFRRIDAKLADFGNPDTSGIEPELFALARQAIDAIAWRSYSRAWPEAMSGQHLHVRGWQQPRVIEYARPAGLDWSDSSDAATGAGDK
jgi:hypothetical protein